MWKEKSNLSVFVKNFNHVSPVSAIGRMLFFYIDIYRFSFKE